MQRDAILLTPGPLTTTERTKQAMLRDWGSWDASFIAVTAELRRQLLAIVHGEDTHVVVPLQGSGTFSVEAAVATHRAADRPCAGARQRRLLQAARQAVDADGPQDDDPAACRGRAGLAAASSRRRCSATRASATSASSIARPAPGSLNPLQAVADVCARHGKGLIVDAMSSFAALPIDAREVKFDALVAASGKCLEGVPGMGFVFIRKEVIDGAAGNSHSLAMDLHDQHVYMEKTGQWRFTPPTHVVAALAEAMRQFEEEGGQPARLARYTANYEALVDGMKALGFEPFLDPAIQAPIIVTFHAPADPKLRFRPFYDAVKTHGFILYPGKLTAARDLPRRLHRRDRPERDEGRGRCRRRRR